MEIAIAAVLIAAMYFIDKNKVWRKALKVCLYGVLAAGLAWGGIVTYSDLHRAHAAKHGTAAPSAPLPPGMTFNRCPVGSIAVPPGFVPDRGSITAWDTNGNPVCIARTAPNTRMKNLQHGYMLDGKFYPDGTLPPGYTVERPH